ncbi:MAG: 2-octaprenyl-6-methoxyphenyl hydroxylase [Xanthomonadaceae bacterium]|nr:2-octaprenyl-6-methoxyphenyl hydroxylase [Xanthomonadaceae bacterium]
MSKQHDVVIVGGGLVGSSLAVALDATGLDVGLVEATPGGAMPPVFDQRNLSFAAATINALKRLDVLSRMRMAPSPIRRIHISRAGDFGRIRLDASDYGREFFGHVVVAREFGEALEARLADLKRLTRYRSARFVGFGPLSDTARTVRVIDDGVERMLTARLLVAADGTRSETRAALGIGVQEHDYGQTLFVTRVRTARPPDGTAYERLGDDGPTALLPRSDRHYGLVHGVARAEAEQVAAWPETAWLERIQRVFGWRVGRFLSSDARSAYPLIRVIADRLVAERAVLMGNAAQTIHPVGAQGFNLGLRDVLTLAEMLQAEPGCDPGADALLARYAQRRGEDRTRTLAFSDNLARLTSNRGPLLRPLRSLGLLALDCSSSLQSFLVGGAMGFRGDVPELCRS